MSVLYRKLQNLYGLKWNPFTPDVPVDGLYVSPLVEDFLYRVENSLVHEGGFALVTGEPGSGKSIVLRLLAQRFSQIRDLRVGAFSRPSSNMADFYRELGELFDVALRPHNRWCGFKNLRASWQEHISQRQMRPVLLIDEAQELAPVLLSELRLLSSTCFDSQIVLTVVLAGDARFTARLTHPQLLPLASRLRTRLQLGGNTSEDLQRMLTHLLERAGNPNLMTSDLQTALCQHASSNPRVLMGHASQLLTAAVQRQCGQLDEKLFLDVNSPQITGSAKLMSRGKVRK